LAVFKDGRLLQYRAINTLMKDSVMNVNKVCISVTIFD